MVSIEIRTQTPLIIQSGEVYYASELVGLNGKKYGRLNVSSLDPRGMIELARELIHGSFSPIDIPDMVRKLITESNNEAKLMYKLELGIPVSLENKNSQISAIIKDPNGVPYIPGSSIKGMLRVALLSRLVEKEYDSLNLDRLKRVLAREKNFLSSKHSKLSRKERDKKIKDLAREINIASSRLDQKLKIKTSHVPGHESEERDFFSLIEVSDFHPPKDNPPKIVLVRQLLSRSEKLQFFEACIGSFRGTIGLAEWAGAVMEKMDEKDISKILGLLELSRSDLDSEKMVSALLDLLDERFGKMIDFPLIGSFHGFLGAQTGLLSKTVLDSIKTHDKKLYDLLILYVKKTVGRNARPTPHLGTRMVMYNKERIRPGIVEIDIIPRNQ